MRVVMALWFRQKIRADIFKKDDMAELTKYSNACVLSPAEYPGCVDEL